VTAATTIRAGDVVPNWVGLPITITGVRADGVYESAYGGEWIAIADDGEMFLFPPAALQETPGDEPQAAVVNMTNAALWYARHDWPVIPLHEPLFDSDGRCVGCTCEEWQRQNGKPGFVCDTPGKHPRIKDWENRATTEDAQIGKWWHAWPSANIGIAAGRAGLVVVDKDTYHAAAEGGTLTLADSETVTSLTGGGGEHLIYAHPQDGPQIRNDDKALPDWVNIRAHGGLFVAPPSLHMSGQRYEWEPGYGPHEVEPAELPAALRALLQPAEVGQRRAAPIAERIAEGGRNNALTSLGGSLRRRGIGGDAIEAALLAVNAAQCDPPLPAEEVQAIAKSVSSYAPAAPSVNGNGAAVAAPPVAFKLDDTGNAERFVTQHGDDVRYDHSTGHWYIWGGTHWRRDDDGAIQRRTKATARAIYDEAATAAQAGNDDLAAQLAKWARATAAEARRNAVLNLAQAELPIAITHDRLNTHDLLVNVQNGTLDLATGQLRPHDRGDLLTYVLPVAFDPAAVCPTWDTFLDRVTGGDKDLAGFLARAVGYTLSGLTTEQCLFFLHGGGANGKSTFVETIMALMGDLGHKARAQVLMQAERDRVSNEVAALAGRRLVVTSELSDGGRLDEGLVKDLTGGDTMSARFLYGEPFTFRPPFKLWLYGNYKPTIKGTDDGIWRRVRLVPFTVQIPEGERDATLPAKLRAELPGILAWAVRGWQDFQRHGLGTPAAVTEATAEYRAESDTLGQFLADCCILAEGATARAGDLYRAYSEWAKANNLRHLTGVRFARALKERGFFNGHDRNGSYWQGVGILATDQAIQESLV
jgi:putative DNA primase/helicase